MPTVRFEGQSVPCEEGAVLRDVLRGAGLSPHNGASTRINCLGFGTCGTCAVEVRGEVGPLTTMENVRLGLAPHRKDSGLRLACQVRVLGDLEVIKHGGFWGQKVGTPRDG